MANPNDESFLEFTFKSEVLTSDQDIVCLCLFFSENILEEKVFNIRLTSFIKDFNYTTDVKNGVINKLIIILPSTDECRVFSQKVFFENQVDRQRFSFLLTSGDPIFLLYDKDEIWQNGNETTLDSISLTSLVKEIKIKGLYNIFEAGNGILQSGPSHHYILQNGFHADKFIRTANILTSSKYIDFIAIFLLGFINEDDKRIYIDTSGIASLIYSVNKLKNIFLKNFGLCIISFNSYSGIEKLIIDGNTKIVISASTSGRLSSKLVAKGFPSEKICTLFYLNEQKPSGKTLCNLIDFNTLNGNGKYSYFKIEKEASCSFCANSSYPIRIVGEQFLPEELKVDTFIFEVPDRPIWLTRFINQYFAKGVITIGDGYPKMEHEIYLHFDKIFENQKLQRRISRFFSSKLPHQIEAIIHYADKGSTFLTELAVEKYGSNLRLLTIPDSDINLYKDLLHDKNILIISSTITSGKQLVETSLKLRDIKCKGICYIVGMSRTPDEYTIDVTRKYIGFDNEYGKDINPLIIVDAIFISDIRITSTFAQSTISSWDAELNFLLQLNKELPIVNARLNDLEKRKLTNNLFWGNSNNNQLQLRPNFAFYTGTDKKTSDTSQAEVFFLLNTILHNIRRNTGKKIFQSAFHRHVLSPEIFIMYNDGVIQASILRSASQIELNYNFLGNNMKIANEMLNVLKYIFGNFDNEIGEATIEFLIAICTKKLQVIAGELKLIIDDLKKKVESSTVSNKVIILELCNYILASLNSDIAINPIS